LPIHPIFRRRNFFDQRIDSEITWQSLTPGVEDWSSNCHTLAFMLKGNIQEPDFLIMLNGQRAGTVDFTIPQTSGKNNLWYQTTDTARDTPDDFTSAALPAKQLKHDTVRVEAMAAVVLQSKKE